MAETERENIRESTLEGLDTAARKGKHGGRPPVITDDMLHTVLQRRAGGESVEQIQPDLIIPTGSARGRAHPSPASTGRSPSTPSARRTPKPSSRPTPTSPPANPAKSPAPVSPSLAERHADYRELLLVTSPQLRENRAQTSVSAARSTTTVVVPGAVLQLGDEPAPGEGGVPDGAGAGAGQGQVEAVLAVVDGQVPGDVDE
jgi:hypothetical protein